MKQGSIIATLLTLATALSATTANAGSAPLQGKFEGVPYLSGGVSLDEREQLLSAAPDYNLELIFARKDGSYLADTNVVVTNPDGRKVLELKGQGPFVLARLPTGKYHVTVASAGKEQMRDTQIPAKGQRQLPFYW
ncbi:carboxypeptidase regulatory-like domain-containing protein [Azoarcus sp. DN11]|uniref:carboxypeptidase regulatory-like domain-containing protein n=1 Tax=Azoarcus sp. DN11 TaxID=356837 RepID=UPI000EF33791|nr:carboxypeptidase regulatory-like domain-containing protein [Azoarcus sp. DN11]AYH44655.1 hypothetical protein CDA09_14875 [Azoarcus sp. DN11]